MADPLSVGLIAPIFNNLPVWAAEHLGYYAASDLAVTTTVRYGVGNVTDSVRDGSSDVGIGTPESVLSDPGGPDELLIVAGNASKLSNGLIARRGIDSIDELRGGTIGVSHPTEGTALLVGEMLAAHGLRVDVDYGLAAIGVASKRWEGIQDGSLDAGLQTPPHKYLAEDAGFANLGDISTYVPDYQFTTVNVRRTWAAEHREVLERFLTCLAGATQWLYDNPDAATALAASEMNTTTEFAQRDYEHFLTTRSLSPALGLSAAGMAKVVSVMARAGTLVADPPESRIELSYLASVAENATSAALSAQLS